MTREHLRRKYRFSIPQHTTSKTYWEGIWRSSLPGLTLVENKVSQYSCNIKHELYVFLDTSALLWFFLHVFMIKTDSLGVGQLPDLFHGFEAVTVSFEFVGQAWGLGGELPGDEPDARGELVPVKARHGGEVGALAGEIFMTRDRDGQEGDQQQSWGPHHVTSERGMRRTKCNWGCGVCQACSGIRPMSADSLPGQWSDGESCEAVTVRAWAWCLERKRRPGLIPTMICPLALLTIQLVCRCKRSCDLIERFLAPHSLLWLWQELKE